MSISLDPDVIPLGEGLAAEDRRSLSNLVEILILNEHKRRQTAPTPTTAEKAEVPA
jgi:hypothetical protein